MTAGVLRGEKGRFQLFGDTINVTSRIENLGLPNRIHLSKHTADLLSEAGKSHWLIRREDQVVAKGKGEMETFFLSLQTKAKECMSEGHSDMSGDSTEVAERTGSTDEDKSSSSFFSPGDKIYRLVHWNSEILLNVLKKIAARRECAGVNRDSPVVLTECEKSIERSALSVLDEVKEIIELPGYRGIGEEEVDIAAVELGQDVSKQLTRYVKTLALMYHDNPFHNFEHASVSNVNRFSWQQCVAILNTNTHAHPNTQKHTLIHCILCFT